MLIVGAGISAIAAANLLVSEGIDDVVILEATDRVGGRIWSIDLGKFTVHPPRHMLSIENRNTFWLVFTRCLLHGRFDKQDCA